MVCDRVDRGVCCPGIRWRQSFPGFGHPQARDVADSGGAVRRVVLLRQKAWPAPKIRSVQAPDRFGPDAVLCAADPAADGESVVWRGPESAAAGNGAVCPVHVLCRFSGGADLPGATVSGDGEGRCAVCHRGFQCDLWHRAYREPVQRLRGGAAAESVAGCVRRGHRLRLRDDLLQNEEPDKNFALHILLPFDNPTPHLIH